MRPRYENKPTRNLRENGGVTTRLLETALDIAREAAALAAERRRGTVTVADSKSSSVDIVTAVDREVEALIRARLAERQPGDGFLGEEGGRADCTTSLTWVIDPIDGTVNFLYDIPHYAVSIAVVEGDPTPGNWTELAGVVINVSSGREFTASAGGGAFADGVPISVNRPESLGQSLLSTGFSYSQYIRTEQARVMATVMPHIRDIRRMGAAALDLTALAAGQIDIYFERMLQPWDHAAGVLIAREAGAEVRGWNGAAPDVDWLLAAHPDLIDDIENVLVEAGAHFELR
jgi:myo-inositol-1(or 4)-monophosphatase